MYKLCVFAGTTEGRELVEYLQSQPAEITACVATEYGETLLHPGGNLRVSAARLTEEDMRRLFETERFDLVVDATHPYAPIVTENIAAACADTRTDYLRLLRGNEESPEDGVFVPDIAGAVEYLNHTEGNILLTTGSKELRAYSAIRDFSRRVYARVLPMEESLRLCEAAGLQPAHILAMQGPFSREMNVAMLRAVAARIMVTKASGSPGGFLQKVAAAREAGAQLLVIGRPPQREGLSFAEVTEELRRRFGFTRRPRVTVAGIGPGAAAAMSGEVREALEAADCVIGAGRMLESMAESGKAVYSAIAPRDIAAFIHENPQFRRFAVAMSGDTGFFSGTRKLLPLLADCDVKILPGLSSLSVLCARLGCSYEDVVTVSLHGREHNILGELRSHRRVFVLVGGENGAGRLCRELSEAGAGDVRVSVGQRLSYPDEKITVGRAEELAEQHFDSLSAVLLEREGPAPIVTHGLPDAVFQRGAGAEGVVPMTKREVRAVSLSLLELRSDSICWDVGAGTGSVSLEMALQAPEGQVYAIEKKEEALALLEENRRKLQVGNLHIIPGLAPEACRALPAPSHVFIGGSSGHMRDIIALALEKNPGVRVVATAIALETAGELSGLLSAFPFREAEAVSLSAARSRRAGPYHLMCGQNPVSIFVMDGGERP